MQSDAVGRLMSGEAIPGFELFEKISEGAVYTSYKARQTALDRWVVLTLMTPEFSADEERSRGVLKEAKKVARLKHPGILQVFDLGQENSRIFLVTEYIEGTSVEQLLKSIGKLPSAKALEIIRAMAGALEFAWVRASLIHGGLTPGRIIIEQNQAKLSGLGLAGLDADQRGGEGDGSYLPPERAPGDRPTVRDDIYALGLIWREMLTGLPTIPEESRGTSPTAGNPPPGVPVSVWKMVRQMTTPDLEQRYAKWTDVVRDFKSVEEGGSGKGGDGISGINNEKPQARKPVLAENPAVIRGAPAKRMMAASSVDAKSFTDAPADGTGLTGGPGAEVPAPGRQWVGVACVILGVWVCAGWWLWRMPGGMELDFTVRDLPSPASLVRPEPAPVSVVPPSDVTVKPAVPAAPATPVVSVPKGPTPEELRQKTEREILEMEDQVAAYLLQEEFGNSVGTLDIILEDSNNDELRRAARPFKDFVAQVAQLNTAVASEMRMKSGEDVTLMVRGKPIKGRLLSVAGAQVELEETVDQKTTILKRHHSIAITDIDPSNRARWLRDGAGPVRKAMLFILAWRSHQPEAVLSRLAGQSGALSGAFQRRVVKTTAARSDTE
jgi:serine/threonine protein kinase